MGRAGVGNTGRRLSLRVPIRHTSNERIVYDILVKPRKAAFPRLTVVAGQCFPIAFTVRINSAGLFGLTIPDHCTIKLAG
jgi:hypothetical protein